MFFYFTCFLILLICSFLEVISNNKRYSQHTFLFLVLICYALSFLRWETGTDWNTYYEMYTWIKSPWNNVFSTGMEPGFAFINNLGKFVFNSYTGVLFLFSTIIYACLGRAYTALSRYPITSLLISFCILSFAHMLYVRQNVAVVILCWSVYYIQKKNFKHFFFCVFIASLFHRTSWIFLISYPFFFKEYSLKFYISAILSALIFGTIISKIILVFIGNLGLGVISTKISGYMELGSEDNSTALSTTTILIKGFINRGFILALIFYCKFKLKYNSSFFTGLVNIYILGTILYFITLPLSVSLARIAVYMDSLQVILIPYIIYLQKTLYNRTLFFTLIIIYYFLRFYSSIITFESSYIPFKTIL